MPPKNEVAAKPTRAAVGMDANEDAGFALDGDAKDEAEGGSGGSADEDEEANEDEE